MKVLIIEDEPLARERLRTMLSKIDSEIQIIAELDSVESSVNWLSNNIQPDLAFFDIQLGDGISFEIFEQINISFPVIFTTAFDEYSIKAFKVNSIDYLLKPYSKQDLQFAVNKYKDIHQNKSSQIDPAIFKLLLEQNAQKSYRKRMMIRIGDKLITIETSTIRFMYSMQKATYAHMQDGKEYLLDESLDAIEPQFDPDQFFRLNRQYILHIDAVGDVITWTNSRLKVNVKGCEDDDVFVSRNKASEFKTWLDK